jgi:hypothetical protein
VDEAVVVVVVVVLVGEWSVEDFQVCQVVDEVAKSATISPIHII